jgi:nitrogen fixation protein
VTAVIRWASIGLVLAAIIGVIQFTIWAGACLLAEGWRHLCDRLDRRRLDRDVPDFTAWEREITADRSTP